MSGFTEEQLADALRRAEAAPCKRSCRRHADQWDKIAAHAWDELDDLVGDYVDGVLDEYARGEDN